VAGRELSVDEARHLVEGDRLVSLLEDADEVAREVVAGAGEARLDEVDAVAPVRDEFSAWWTCSSSSTRWTAAGRCRYGACVFSLENVPGSLKIAWTSS
jgi:hypothetical protein